MGERLQQAEHENQALRRQAGEEDPRPPPQDPRPPPQDAAEEAGSLRSRPGSLSRGSSRGAPDAEQALKENEALQREIIRLRSCLSAKGGASSAPPGAGGD